MQLANLKDEISDENGAIDDIEDVVELIDGYEDVGEEFQEWIKGALKDGHVPDEDWKGVRCESMSCDQGDNIH